MQRSLPLFKKGGNNVQPINVSLPARRGTFRPYSTAAVFIVSLALAIIGNLMLKGKIPPAYKVSFGAHRAIGKTALALGVLGIICLSSSRRRAQSVRQVDWAGSPPPRYEDLPPPYSETEPRGKA